MAITSVDLHLLNMAKMAGEKSQFSKKKRGALIARQNQIIAEGVNSHLDSKSSKIDDNERYIATVNAEIVAVGVAIRKKEDLGSCTIYCSDEPNWIVFKSLITFGIKRIIHFGPTKSDRIKHYSLQLGVEILGIGMVSK